MTSEDIIKMAKEYADEVTNGYGVVTYEFDLYGLEKFALLIRSVEREACAQVLDEMAAKDTLSNYYKVAALAIRGRLAEPDLARVGEVGVWGERQWQGLTDEERSYLAWESNNGSHCVAMTEAKLKEKNYDKS